MKTHVLSILIAMIGQLTHAQSCTYANYAKPCDMASTHGADFWQGTWTAHAGPQRVTVLGRTEYGTQEILGPAQIRATVDGSIGVVVAGTTIDGRKNGFAGALPSIPRQDRTIFFWEEELEDGLINLSLDDMETVLACQVIDLPHWSATVQSADGYALQFDMIAFDAQLIVGYLSFDGLIEGTHIVLDRRVNFQRETWPTDANGVVWEEGSAAVCESVCTDAPERCRDWNG